MRKFIFRGVLVLIIVCAVVLACRRESFDVGPGVLDQLASTHVPTAEDTNWWRAEWKQMQRDLVDLNGPGYMVSNDPTSASSSLYGRVGQPMYR